MLLTDATEQYLSANRKIKCDKTYSHYRLAISQYIAAINKPLAKITDLSDDGLVALEKFLGKRSVTTVNERLGRVMAVWRWLCMKGQLSVWPTTKKAAEPEPFRRAWTVEDVRAILQSCAAQPGHYCGVKASDWWRCWHLLQWETGERTGAMLRLEWDWLRRGGLDIPAEARKGQKAAWYLLSENVISELGKIRPPKRKLLFPWTLTVHSFYNHYARILRCAGLPTDRKCKPQRMRRTHLTYWCLGGEDASLRAKHVDSETTRKHYLDESILGGIDPSKVLPKL
jgi:integrase